MSRQSNLATLPFEDGALKQVRKFLEPLRNSGMSYPEFFRCPRKIIPFENVGEYKEIIEVQTSKVFDVYVVHCKPPAQVVSTRSL